MSLAAHMLIEAKQSIVEEQLQRFLDLRRQKRWVEAEKHLGITLACVADLLDEGVQTLVALESQTTQRPQFVPPDNSGECCYLEDGGERWER